MALIKIFQTTQSDLLQHNGKQLEIIRKLTEEEVDEYEFITMYEIKLETGEQIHAFKDEIPLPPKFSFFLLH